MSFVTIIQKNTEKPMVFHGVLLKRNEGNFEVSVVNQNGIREQWICHYDFWNLIE